MVRWRRTRYNDDMFKNNTALNEPNSSPRETGFTPVPSSSPAATGGPAQPRAPGFPFGSDLRSLRARPWPQACAGCLLAALALATLTLALSPLPASSAGIPEPGLTLYGKVLNKFNG